MTSDSHRIPRLAAALAAVLLLVPTLSACGGDDPADDRPALSSTAHNDADVEFATAMIQHHAQAMSMVDLAAERDLDPKVQRLAEAIRAAQGPEIETMVDWLQEWGEDIPETMRDHVNMGHHGDIGEAMEGMDTDMPGMMSAEDMTALQDATDAEFQDLWLTMMVEHHEGAVEMAETEQDAGQYRPAVELADRIVTTQTAEIEQMERLR
ncbi:uncharacterized protein (DUF305 family) [Nocardioides thalensis]|uniref:Uncharacterized protein (DUF305 family) n=1 Tax=Nocardioides thalensis TaxID=1914755 RepID=A0A853BYG5_9ACTN|nr:DUF305 domain-containing protein [Nocardioides thalensis]NYI99795.1 uncharacterized protein (DUF305 family) [Nocardioides thalensis]